MSLDLFNSSFAGLVSPLALWVVVERPLDVADDVDWFSAAGDDLRFNPPSVSCSYGGDIMISSSSTADGSGSTVAPNP